MLFGYDAGSVRRLRYVGPPHTAAEAARCPGGRVIHGYADLASWCEQPTSDAGEPFTYVVDLAGRLRLAPRRSEHVACAGGADVLAAGEMGFARVAGSWQVSLVSNLSTGYCPDLDSWNAIAAALAAAGIAHPDTFTDAVVFHLCPACGERNLVKEQVYACAICDGPLPAGWNFDTATGHDR